MKIKCVQYLETLGKMFETHGVTHANELQTSAEVSLGFETQVSEPVGHTVQSQGRMLA